MFMFKNAVAVATPWWTSRITPGPAPESVSVGRGLRYQPSALLIRSFNDACLI